jgi:hypothetical protein
MNCVRAATRQAAVALRRLHLGAGFRVVWATLLAFATNAAAQDLEPRAYSNLPVGLNFLVAGYQHSRGDVVTDATLPLEDGEVTFQGPVLGYARAIAIRGRSAKIDVIVPYGWVSGSATYLGEPREREVHGLADPRVRLSMNFLGAPALNLEQFLSYKPDLVVGGSVQVGMPLGQYDSAKLVNIGTNRWLIKPEIGLAKTWRDWTLELAAALSIYTRNEDFLGGKTLEQDPVHSLQAHLVYSLPLGIWAAFDVTYYGGGEADIDGMPSGESFSSTRIGGTAALPLGRHHSLKVFGSTGATSRLGSDFDTAGVAWQYRWGAGL